MGSNLQQLQQVDLLDTLNKTGNQHLLISTSLPSSESAPCSPLNNAGALCDAGDAPLRGAGLVAARDGGRVVGVCRGTSCRFLVVVSGFGGLAWSSSSV